MNGYLDVSTVDTIVTSINDLEVHMVMNTSDLYRQSLTPNFHAHPYFEIITVVNGSLYIESLGNDRIYLTPGAVCIVPPGLMHCTNSQSELHEIIAMRFFYEHVKSDDSRTYKLFDDALAKLDTIVFLPSEVQLTGYITAIRREFGDKRLMSEAIVQALLQCTFIELLRVLSSSPESGENAVSGHDDSKIFRYSYIDRWFYKHYAERVTEADLAAELNLSQRQLSRVMRDIFGMSFREKLVYERLNHAMHMIIRNDYSIDKIATAVGYTNLSGFYKAFRARFGMTVGEYRKLHGGENNIYNYPAGT